MGRLVPPHALLHSLNGSVKNILHVGNSVFSDGLLFPSYPHSKQRQQQRQPQQQQQEKKKKKVLATGLQFMRCWPQPPLRPQQSAPHPSPFPSPSLLSPLSNLLSRALQKTSCLVVSSLNIMLKYKEARLSLSRPPLSLASALSWGFGSKVLSFLHPLLRGHLGTVFLAFSSARTFPGNSPLSFACIRNVCKN